MLVLATNESEIFNERRKRTTNKKDEEKHKAKHENGRHKFLFRFEHKINMAMMETLFIYFAQMFIKWNEIETYLIFHLTF